MEPDNYSSIKCLNNPFQNNDKNILIVKEEGSTFPEPRKEPFFEEKKEIFFENKSQLTLNLNKLEANCQLPLNLKEKLINNQGRESFTHRVAAKEQNVTISPNRIKTDREINPRNKQLDKPAQS